MFEAGLHLALLLLPSSFPSKIRPSMVAKWRCERGSVTATLLCTSAKPHRVSQTGSCVSGGNDLTCSIDGICLPRSESFEGTYWLHIYQTWSIVGAIIKLMFPDASSQLSPENLKEARHAHFVHLMICNAPIWDSKLLLLSSHLIVATGFLRSNTAIHHLWKAAWRWPSRGSRQTSGACLARKSLGQRQIHPCWSVSVWLCCSTIHRWTRCRASD